MVHLEGQGREGIKGQLVLTEDGSIISSSGDLASSEQTAQTCVSLISHTLQADFTPQGQNGYANPGVVGDNGAVGDGPSGIVAKWNRLTVAFPDNTFVVSLSNKRIHVVKKDSTLPPDPPADQLNANEI